MKRKKAAEARFEPRVLRSRSGRNSQPEAATKVGEKRESPVETNKEEPEVAKIQKTD